MDNCEKCPQAFGENVLYQAESGKEAGCENVYVFPSPDAQMIHKELMKRISRSLYGIIQVNGPVGTGKSSYMQYLKSQIQSSRLFLSETIIADAKEVGQPGYLPKSIIGGLKIPDHGWIGFLDKVLHDDVFKTELARAMKKYEAELDFECRPLAVAFSAISSDDKELVDAATNWLRGIPPPSGADKEKRYLERLRKEGMPTTEKSVRTLSVKEVIYFIRTLSIRMGYSGFMVLVDEIEKAAELTKSKGRIFLDNLRDLINILMEAPEGTIPNQKGLFVAFAVSTEYLMYSGVIVSTLDYAEMGRSAIKMKTKLTDSPRLATILNSMTQRLNSEVKNRETHIEIGMKFVECYAHTNGVKSRDRAFVERVLSAVEEDPKFKTRSFVTAIMKDLASAE